MSQRAPQTLSVKRKRTEAPVDSLIFDNNNDRDNADTRDNSVKRQRSTADIFFRRLTKPGDTANTTPPDSSASTPTTERRFHLDPISRAKSKHVFIERRAATEPSTPNLGPSPLSTHQATPSAVPSARPRKRPGTRAASSAHTTTPSTTSSTHRSQPSEHDVRELEALSHRVEHEEKAPTTNPISPSKYKPRAPSLRFADREPLKAAALASRDGLGTDPDAMDLDNEGDYVIDTYVLEPLLPDSLGNLPTSTGSVGYLVLSATDEEEWWATGANAEDSDKEFDTDDDDSNAEEYYANDYPEDELSDDDEFGRDPYKRAHRRGSSDEEFDAADSGDDDGVRSGEDEDDVHYRMTVPKAKRAVGYWGMNGGV
ncbi:hypothetical protein E8E13_001200 [Curvularia kusanoi]|uniref:Transcription factor Iwr1 domain-containing protein n=1 Tax=Curvularia kusanoi TaxID=90978 RepID=A0A9P4W4G6_CURKU|nr:hypothetical protein E8E13_001200 [Curvularia kusanoi]